MPKNQTLFEATEGIVEELRELEADDERPGRIFTVRRRLEQAQNEFLKQGIRIPVTKKFGRDSKIIFSILYPSL